MTVATESAVINEGGLLSEEILNCLRCLYSTIEGTCPMDREFGISIECVDKPLPIAKNLYVLDVMKKTEIYEPRVEVVEITFEAENEKLIPHIKVCENEDYEEGNGEEDEEE